MTVFFVYNASTLWKDPYTFQASVQKPLRKDSRATNSSPRSNFNEKRIITLEDDEFLHFQSVGIAPLCYTEGTDVAATLSTNSTECHCKTNYFGRECGIPAAVWHRTISKKYHKWPIKPRKVPRRIIHGLNINHEVDFFRVRLEELQVKSSKIWKFTYKHSTLHECVTS